MRPERDDESPSPREGTTSQYGELLKRAISLRKVLGFTSLSAQDLEAVAGSARERFFRRRARILNEGSPTSAIYAVVRGGIVVRRRGRYFRRFGTAEQAGALAYFARDPRGVQAEAHEDTIALELGAADLDELMDDRVSILLGMLKSMVTLLCPTGTGCSDAIAVPATAEDAAPVVLTAGNLIERVILLNRLPLLRGVPVEALTRLAEQAERVEIGSGETIAMHTGAPASTAGWLVIVSGSVHADLGAGAPSVALRPGCSAGLLRELGGGQPWSVTAGDEAVVLRLVSGALPELIEDDTEVGRMILANMARRVMQNYEDEAVGGAVDEASALASKRRPA